MKQPATKWEATKTPGLYVRRPGGGYYARVTLNGKRSWRSLKTDKLREAQSALRDLQSGHTRQVSTRKNDKLHAAMTKVIEFRSIRRGVGRPLKASTLAYHAEILAAAKKHFPDRSLGEFDDVGILKIIEATGYSRSRKKAIFELLKQTFAKAVEGKAIGHNPLSGHIPPQVPRKERDLPTREQLEEVMKKLPEMYPRYGHRSVLTLRFLMFSGMRISEAKAIQWSDIQNGKIVIRGGQGGLKSREEGASRRLHINPPLQAVLDEIGGIYGREGRVIPAKSVRAQLKAVCKKLKIMELNHHDLRAWFITWNITSGTDVSTLAEWVGNSPKVLLERYASVQDELRQKAADNLS